MNKFLRYILAIMLGTLPLEYAVAAEPVSLSEETYKADSGIVIVQINWGRTWQCGHFENAQLETLEFSMLPAESPDSATLVLETPSVVSVDNKFLPYAFVVHPGEYALTAFDVKVAKSMTDVGHFKATTDRLIRDGKAVGGSFKVGPGEIVYIGHFGLECGAEPFLWRYYVESRDEFERYVDGFRKKYPFMQNMPVEFRLFSTQAFGEPFSLQNPIVK